MLKALELIGFKSFADKTRFEFPEGITVVVGPNGSGKSNIVDAIKWVLGEQSAKSLRGKEMADVIFKGTGSGGRKPANTAEATVVFDNSQRTFPLDAPEVHVTRRVYRSGEGEYLINSKPCRLKDIRDMFRGTGVGVDAYSLIEQGKVDSLLQASSKDRRAIFEEAAGISRFKAKKIEAQRRLERVEQNLLRLSDIVDEVDNRLRSVRAQASKAQRYREYSERLQQLRTQVGVTDWRRLTEKLATIEQELASSRDQIATLTGEADALEGRLQESSTALETTSERLRSLEAEQAGNREQIAGREAAASDERSRGEEFAEEVERHRQRLRAMTHRAGDLHDRLRTARHELAKAEAENAGIRARLEERERTFADLARHVDRVRNENEARRTRHVEGMRHAAALGNQASGLESQLNAFQASAQRTSARLQELEQAAARHDDELQRSVADEQGLAQQAGEKAASLETAQVELGENRRVLARRQQELALLQGKLSAMRQRADFLQELERQHAGLSAGVQEVLAAAKQQSADIAQEIHGMVADVIDAGVEVAPLVDVALGDAAQHIIISGERLIRRIESGDFRATGRVGLMRLDTVTTTQPLLLGPLMMPGRGELQGRPGVVGRADRLVRTTEPYRGLVSHLLGDTWFVERLADALALSRTVGKGLRFVTSKGELLEADGTLIVGPSQANVGLVSRRSELRSLQREIVDLQRRAVQFSEEITRLQENIDRQDRQAKLLTDACRKLDAALADQRVRTRTLQDRHEQLQRQKDSLAAELNDTLGRRDAAQQQAAALRDELARQDAEVAELEGLIRQDEQRVDQIQSRLDVCNRDLTRDQVELAKSEQRLEGLRVQATQFETDQRERSRALSEVHTQLAQAAHRQAQSELHVLRLTSELAELFLRKERLAANLVELRGARERLAAERSQLATEQETLRRRIRRIEEQQHKLELSAGEVQHERNTLAGRIREDYGIEISQVTQREETAEEEQQRAEIETEINDLRNKINRIGAVNLDALDEVDDLQSRYGKLSAQYQDLTQAKESLERIIQKINADSRRLFLETLEGIRSNFQVLYRKAFGGGRADLVLEEGKDVLEAGVDIMATPPGKPSFSNTLLSGGEKALTAVALLMAIFQFRPSPFCILDEVDAPFDEANIGRFVNVLKDFLASTKFVIVTHSKKTMGSANTLYGVTMQESGVSKRVSVRFEDVSEDGHISAEAVRREDMSPIEEERAA